MVKHPWTPERRERQRALMLERKPWLKSTGPRTAKGKAKASGNARKHGLRSQPAKDIAKARTHAKRGVPETRKFLAEAGAVLRALGLC